MENIILSSTDWTAIGWKSISPSNASRKASYVSVSSFNKNLYKDFLREKNKISKIETSPLNLKNTNYPTSISPEEIVINSQKLEHILESMKSLKDEYKKILQLRFFEDLSYKEISEKLNQPLNTVKVKILRAKNLLNIKINAENHY